MRGGSIGDTFEEDASEHVDENETDATDSTGNEIYAL